MHDEAVEQAALLPLPRPEHAVEAAVGVVEASLPSPTLRSVTAKPNEAAVG